MFINYFNSKAKTIAVFFFFTFFVFTNVNAQTIRVLFIGNSLTFANDMPLMFKQLAQSAGKQVFTEDATSGGATLQNHLNSTSTISKIQQGNWDYVVLQEQSQLPSWENDRDSMFYPYAKSLDSIIKAYNPCGKTVFFLTYAHRNGDLGILQNGGSDTYWDMQQRIRDGYMEIADSLNAMVCPVGWAFRQSRILYPNLELYQPDHNHPTDTGTYIGACAFYSTIFQDSSIGIPFSANIGSTTAALLQQLSSEIVMDSLSLWNIGQAILNPTADFAYSDTNLTVNFHDSSSNAINYFWNFGDGVTSTNTNPVHTYPAAGNYNVFLKVDNGCGTDTITKKIVLAAAAQYPIADFSFSYLPNAYTVSFSDSSQFASTYYWNFGDGDTSAQKDIIHTFPYDSTYNVLLIVNNSWGVDSISKQVTINYSALKDVKQEFNLSVFPNPANQYLNIITNLKDFALEIRSIDNSIIMLNESVGNTKVDVSELPQGIYFIVLTSEKGSRVVKFIKE